MPRWRRNDRSPWRRWVRRRFRRKLLGALHVPTILSGHAAKQRLSYDRKVHELVLLGCNPEPYLARARTVSQRSFLTFLAALENEIWRARQGLGPSAD